MSAEALRGDRAVWAARRARGRAARRRGAAGAVRFHEEPVGEHGPGRVAELRRHDEPLAGAEDPEHAEGLLRQRLDHLEALVHESGRIDGYYASTQLELAIRLNDAAQALPAVRVDVNPTALYNNGLGLEDVRAAMSGR